MTADERNGHEDPPVAPDGVQSEDTPSTPDPVTPQPAGTQTAKSSHSRVLWINVLIGVTTLLLVVGMFAVWANRLLFNPDNWSNTSTQLLANPDIRSGTANYLVDQLYSQVDVPALLRQGLPSQLDPLAGPAAGALRNGAVQATELALTRPAVQNLWTRANRAADQAFIAVVNGGTNRVGVNNGVVTLNLGPMLDNVAGRLGLPANLSANLPPHIATLTLFRSDQLSFVEKVGKAIRGLALLLTILVPVLYALAILLAAGHRRRTLMTVGFAAVFGGVVVLFGRRVLETQITNSLTSDATLRPAVRATIAIGTQILSDIGGAAILIGALLVAAAWFAGPARVARTAREGIAPFLRERAVASYAITLGVMVLVFIWDPIYATGTPAGIIVFTLLAVLGTALLRRQTAQEFPGARPGAATAAISARLTSMRDRRREPTPPTTSATTAEQLTQLAALRDRGEISSEDYQTAKTKLLHA